MITVFVISLVISLFYFGLVFLVDMILDDFGFSIIIAAGLPFVVIAIYIVISSILDALI